MLSRDDMVVLLFIYASNNVNIGANLLTKTIYNDSIKWEKILNSLRTQGLLTNIRGHYTKNKTNSEIIYCKVTQNGKIEAENSFKLFVLKTLVAKEQFSWDELKVLIIQEFHCSEIPEHIRKFGMKIIQEFICIEILTYPGPSFNIINTIFNVNKEKFKKK